jgi:hypothetical protein
MAASAPAAHPATRRVWARPVTGLLLVLACAAAAVAGLKMASDPLQQVTAAAAAAQADCYGRIHHDTYAFESCVLGLLKTEREPDARRLGIEYFGYVGAMNSARMGMQGAETTAYVFLTRFRRTQKRLGLGDIELCRSVPGDCEVRVARIKLMESAPEARMPPARDPSAEQQDEH